MLLCAAPVAAQQIPATERAVQGKVVIPAREGNNPVAGVWVTLHRVGTDAAGPLDSMRTDARGQYRFRYRPSGSENATYFVTASYAGIAYFAAPLGSGDVRGEEAEITVFDTASANVRLRVRGRHIAAALRTQSRRTVIEVYEISNDTTITLVAGQPEKPTFVALVPESARDVRVGEGDVPAEATRAERGRLLVFAPVAPGLKQLSISYTIGDDDIPLTAPVRDSTDVLEVLLEEPGATAEGPGLRDLGDVTSEGRRFRRYLAQDVPGGSTVRLVMPEAPLSARWGVYVTVLLAVLAVVMLGALARVLLRPRRAVVFAPIASQRASDRIAREIALLDEQIAAGAASGAAEQRGKLKARLVRALAAEQGQR